MGINSQMISYGFGRRMFTNQQKASSSKVTRNEIVQHVLSLEFGWFTDFDAYNSGFRGFP